ncbi:hypothetical protein HYALB_00008393 [Hymenoscyphus albidus]|uniref:Zinc knuckle protein n=1 Tax=Hymenoscyphus albidus TaxID=595503 RepID=A0A9N9LI60_9HELO|nr:hypothetical protein HYALB_00008393 [Hymenoscyphus albidus]
MASASTPGSVPKAMSSRLLTMKFMQRAAASPTSPSPSTPDEPPNKRRKKNGDASPSPFSVDALADQRAVQKALAEEEAIRQVALERQAAEAGDTRWVLSFEDDGPQAASPTMALRVVQTGYANLDSISSHQIRTEEDEPQDKPIMVGRRSFGKFNRVLEKQQDPTLEDSSDSDESENDGSEDDADGDSDDPMNNLIKTSRAEATQRLKAERKAKKKAEKSKTADLAKQRKKKAVNLNGLTSLSGSQSRSSSGPSGPPRGPCYSCGGPHMRAECPDNKRRYPGGDDDGRPRKSIRSR